MKNRNGYMIMIQGAAGLLLLLVGFATGWYVSGDENVDVVHDVEPMSEVFLGIDETLVVLAGMETPQQQMSYLDRHYPNLGSDVAYWLNRDGRLDQNHNGRFDQNEEVDHVEFRFGSLDNVTAESGDGNMRHGYFKNQLVAIVYPVSGEPMKFILQCINGLTVGAQQLMTLHPMGDRTPVMQFTIARGEGLTHHVGFLTAIDIADQHGLPLYRGRKIAERHLITPAVARELELTTDRIQVTVYVEPGDYFDLRNNTYTSVRRNF